MDYEKKEETMKKEESSIMEKRSMADNINVKDLFHREGFDRLFLTATKLRNQYASYESNYGNSRTEDRDR